MHIVKKVQYAIEFVFVGLIVIVLSFFPPEKASNIGGQLGRKIGARLKGASRRALTHLQMSIPGKSDEEYRRIIAAMWDNLGRTVAEYPELETIAADVELQGIEHLRHALEQHDKVIMFSGHIGNWELMATCLAEYGFKIDLVYRALNNPYVDKLMTHYRSLKGKLRTYPKSAQGTRQLVAALKANRSVGILIDQKYNEGLRVPFFGQPAMTSDAFVRLSQKFDAPLVPCRIERINGIQFRVSFEPALRVRDDAGQPRPAESVIADAHALLERWIRERPDQWLWLHRRWVKSAGKETEAGVKKPLSETLPDDMIG